MMGTSIMRSGLLSDFATGRLEGFLQQTDLDGLLVGALSRSS